ncbi:unnamed protein product [Protopolystoma xenopodis]|uniref:Uncharacterized protein n=1 Tax=Protopolystoma xenopodis TaxID=117903 RepID=A0A448XRT8_9PLAT|nr:unnamed protein product [Protopolystoma xenopodis]
MAKRTDNADYDAGETFEKVLRPLSEAGKHVNYYGRRLLIRLFFWQFYLSSFVICQTFVHLNAFMDVTYERQNAKRSNSYLLPCDS